MSTTNSAPVASPDRAAFAATANRQTTSSFFSLLPAEIRQLIYIEFWRSSGAGSLRQHITRKSGRLTCVPCVTDPLAEDVRYTKFNNASNTSDERSEWLQRLSTEWCLHWACEESSLAQQGTSKTSSFLPVLLSCKSMYLESLPTIYDNVNFVFTDLWVADEFLGSYMPGPLPITNGEDNLGTAAQPPISFRSIELCIRTSPLLTEIYFPYSEMAFPGVNLSEGPNPNLGGSRLSMDNNPWARICSHLAYQPSLQDLRIWFDTRDLRPWHRRVSEIRMFGRLFGVRTKSKERFILELPVLPDAIPEQSLDLSPHRMGRHHCLEGEMLDTAPFIVVRGPRPNNWRVHMGDRYRFMTDSGRGN